LSFSRKLKTQAARALTSRGLQTSRRYVHEVKRRLTGQPHVVRYFHDVSDPYSFLAVQVLQQIQGRYGIYLQPYLISGPPIDMMPAPAKYRHNAFRDAVRLANRLGLVPPTLSDPEPQAIAKAEGKLAYVLDADEFVSQAQAVTQAVWSGRPIPDGPSADSLSAKQHGDQVLASVGHYQGGCFAYAGETYWGLDRLHYLETRLQELGLGETGAPIVPDIVAEPPIAKGEEIEFFFSFRSPYSYLAFDRVCDLARRSQSYLILKPVLPMLMRGLPVPPAKSSYILRDCSRETRRLGIPFGRISDPLGAGVERGYALLDYAEERGRLAEYCSAFLSAVWSRGLDAATDDGLAEIATAAGLDWEDAKTQLGSSAWRNRVEVNQNRLQDCGLWGVPSFRVKGQSFWGQDRLWVIADLLREGPGAKKKAP
jgi:2-hydroxychromene-2-carboxylate isomerase